MTFETWNEPLNNFIYSNGGDWLSKDGKEFTLNKPEAAEAIQKLADLINLYHVAPSPLAAKSLPAMNVALQSGISAMAIGGQWMNLDLGNAKVNYDIGVLPKLKTKLAVDYPAQRYSSRIPNIRRKLGCCSNGCLILKVRLTVFKRSMDADNEEMVYESCSCS